MQPVTGFVAATTAGISVRLRAAPLHPRCNVCQREPVVMAKGGRKGKPSTKLSSGKAGRKSAARNSKSRGVGFQASPAKEAAKKESDASAEGKDSSDVEGKVADHSTPGVSASKTATKEESVGNQTDESEKNPMDFNAPSGEQGDATPHRAFDADGQPQLEDPIAQVKAEAQEGKLESKPKRLTGIKPDSSERWEWGTSIDTCVERLAAAEKDGKLALTVVSNRHFITERFYIQFTSAILQAEAEKSTGEAEKMRKLRNEIIAICWEFDSDLRSELYPAEARLVKVIQGDSGKDLGRLVEKNCGSTENAVTAFWIVVFAAVAAWEEKGAMGADSSELPKRLQGIAKATENSKNMEALLAPALKSARQVLVATDQNEQVSAFEDADEEVIVDLLTTLERVRIWPQNSYGPLVSKLEQIAEFAVTQVTDTVMPDYRLYEFDRTEMVKESRLIEFIDKNAKKNMGRRW